MRSQHGLAAAKLERHLYLLQKSSGMITAAVDGNFFAPKQRTRASTAARSKAARSSAARSTAVCARRRCARRRCCSARRRCARRRCARRRHAQRRRALLWHARRRHTHVRPLAFDRLVDGGALGAARARRWCARRRCARRRHAQRRRTLNGGTLEPRRRHCCRRKEFFSCFTELLQITVVTRRRRDHVTAA